jgi:hypothetical protein
MMHQRSDFPEKAPLRESHGEEQRISNGCMSSLFVLGPSFRESHRIELSPESLDPYQKDFLPVSI